MATEVSIGEFSRLCHLSAKTLRFYHGIDMLVPAAVDERTGYRVYSTDQVGDAHLIRRLRDLDMPLAEIRQVLVEADGESRSEVLVRHLDRMETELTRTREVVLSLRRLLGATPRGRVTHRHAPAETAVWLAARLARTEVADWCGQIYPRLYGILADHAIDPAGAAGATYSTEFFEQDEGEVVAFVPVLPDAPTGSDGRFTVLPRRRFAVAVHTGPFADCDVTYGWLGSHVAEHDLGLPEPIVERYLIGPDHTDDPSQFQTEICWPIDEGEHL
jgi:DNA-binding transcriptional MerR regulator/effector-binding domain-containing protein